MLPKQTLSGVLLKKCLVQAVDQIQEYKRPTLANNFNMTVQMAALSESEL